MSAFRHLACRQPLVLVLVVLNITALLLIWSSYQTQDVEFNHRGSGYDAAESPGLKLVTLTETAVATVTVPVQTETAEPTPIRAPGPTFCNTCGPEDSLCTLYGEHNLARSRVYEGANARFRRVIANALAGKPTKIGVLGGSVTKGHGLRHGNVENWANRFHDAWKTLFPNSATTLINGAVAATGSDYLSMCFREHIDEDVDLVIVELLINDQRKESNALAYEWLLRGLLELPNNPAVINMHTIGLSFEFITTGGDLHTPVAEYYDSPIVSVRNMLTPHILKHAEIDGHYFAELGDGKPDWRHVNLHGHKVMSDLLVAYTQRQICAVERVKADPPHYTTDETLPGLDGLDTIPRLRLFQKYDRETITGPITPTCQSIRTTKHPLTPIDNRGWRQWKYSEQSDKPYLIATEPGATVKFEVNSALLGRVRITHLKSKTFGLGDVWCWLDDDRENGTRVVSWWNVDTINAAVVSEITRNATPGKHVLTCEVMNETTDPSGGNEFRLIAVDAA